MYSSSAVLKVWFTATAVLVTKLLLGRQKSQFTIAWRSTKGPGQKNLVNTDGILLFKHKPLIPISLQVPLSLQSSLAKPAPPRLRLLKHSTFFPGCLCVAVLLFQNCILLHFGPFFFLPITPLYHSSLHATIFTPSKWVGSGLYMPQIPPTPSTLQKMVNWSQLPGFPVNKWMLRLEEATKCLLSV